MNLHFHAYRLENVYLRADDFQRGDIIALWEAHRAVPDPSQRVRRSHEVVYMVRNAAAELVGVSSVGLAPAPDGRLFYHYRMFIRPQDRVPYLMWAVTDATRDDLREFRHPDAAPVGLLIVTENPKLMRPGMRRSFERHGYDYRGKTAQGLDIWRVVF